MKVIDTAKELEAQAQTLFERIKKTQDALGETLTALRSAEGKLTQKEQQEAKERADREKAERLRELLDREGDLAFHVGEPDVTEAPESPAPVVESAPPAPAPEAPAAAEQTRKVEEPATPRQETKPSEKAASDETPAAKAESPAQKPAHQPKPTPQQERPPMSGSLQQDGQQQRPAQGGQQQRPAQGGYQQRPAQDGYQQRPAQGGYQQRPAQDGYQQRPAQGGYQQRPAQGGYQQRPAQGGYQQRPAQGGYQQRPAQGGYQQRPAQGDYQQRPAQGGYQQRPAQGGYQQRPAQGGNQQQRTGQGSYQQRPQQGGRPRTGQDGQQRPAQGGYQARPAARTAAPAPASPPRGIVGNGTGNRRREDDRKGKSKKAIMKEAAPKIAWDDDTPTGRKHRRKTQQMHKPEPVVIEKVTLTTEMVTVKELSEKIGKPAAEIIKKLFILGIMATINQEIDFDTCSLIAGEYGIDVEQQIAKTAEDVLNESMEDVDSEENLEPRPPVVTIMGHVDHGKTSLLDAIRQSSITEGEAGGITQHIGAYTVTCNGRQITFIDTPGHEAFTAMRARGAQVTDIVILVVAADDGIMPQTVEAINHAKAAGVPIIVAINKMDKEGADPDRIKQQLTEHELVSEEWGGDTICVPVSAKKKQGLDTLLEMVLLQADVLELKANPNRIAKGTIIEAELHKGRGPIATVLVQSGTLKIGDPIVAGTAYGRVRALMDDKGRRVTEAGPSQPVEVLGFSEVPSAGDVMNVAEVDKLSRQVAEERRDKQKAEQLKAMTKVSLDDLFNQIAEGQVKDLNIIVKADVQGSVEAVKQALEKLSNDEVRIKCIHGGVGAITGSDIMFASASNAIVIGFNVRPDTMARETAERENVDVRLYRIIYQAIEDIEKAMKGMFAPVYKEVELGRITVRNTFKVSGVGTIAGAYVNSGNDIVLGSSADGSVWTAPYVVAVTPDNVDRFPDIAAFDGDRDGDTELAVSWTEEAASETEKSAVKLAYIETAAGEYSTYRIT
ncbi:MAG: translation initiation factor IF-2, partial [Clostridia bacterium]|nr:translation initiation factor IF-2 [Clostridia bacterium]